MEIPPDPDDLSIRAPAAAFTGRYPPRVIPAKLSGMSEKPAAPPQPLQLQIEIDPVTANGAFVNLALVNHTETEFTLDLVYVQPQAPKGVVRARAITTPKHMKRLLAAIQDNLAKYEARFGKVDVGDAPHFPQTGIVN
jgi:hypothetical protein